MNFDESNDFMSDESDNWKEKILKNKKKRYSFDFADKYREYLILRFFEMKRDERLWNDRLSRIRINEELSVQKKIVNWNAVSSKNLFDLKIFENWKNQIENQLVNENSHDFSSNLTNFEFSNFARVEWRDFDDDQKATAQ